MNKLQLLIETPRAGKWNHRFIVADDSTLSESEITKIISAARRNLQGDDYIAVSSETAQSVSGRKGKEILVLVGIDIKQLSDVERLKLEQKLANIDIETFVTETIDWNKDGKELLVCRSELTEWEKDFCSWSKFSYSEKKSLLSKLNSNKLKLIAGVVGILVVLGIGFLMTSFEDPKTKNIDGSENQSAENLTDNELGTPSTVAGNEKNDTPNDKVKEKIVNMDLSDVVCNKMEFIKNCKNENTPQNNMIDVCVVLKTAKNNPNFLTKLSKKTAWTDINKDVENHFKKCLSNSEEDNVYEAIEFLIKSNQILITLPKEEK